MTALDTQVGGDHYKHLAIQPIEYCVKNKLGYCESLAIKYITRHKDKNGAEDIRKAIHTLQLLLELHYPAVLPVNPEGEPAIVHTIPDEE